MWVGTMAGNGNTDANDYDGTDKSDDFFTGGVGFNIPLGSKKNYNNCDRVLAIVEAEKFIKMVGSLKDLGVMDEVKAKTVVNKYLVSTENKLGIDILAHGLDEKTALAIESACIDLMGIDILENLVRGHGCLLYTSPSPRDNTGSRMPSSA